jgi:hypothetical protein
MTVQLPFELLLLCIAHLTGKDSVRASEVCKRWREAYIQLNRNSNMLHLVLPSAIREFTIDEVHPVTRILNHPVPTFLITLSVSVQVFNVSVLLPFLTAIANVPSLELIGCDGPLSGRWKMVIANIFARETVKLVNLAFYGLPLRSMFNWVNPQEKPTAGTGCNLFPTGSAPGARRILASGVCLVPGQTRHLSLIDCRGIDFRNGFSDGHVANLVSLTLMGSREILNHDLKCIQATCKQLKALTLGGLPQLTMAGLVALGPSKSLEKLTLLSPMGSQPWLHHEALPVVVMVPGWCTAVRTINVETGIFIGGIACDDLELPEGRPHIEYNPSAKIVT